MHIDELLERAGNLKEALVDYASSPGFARRLSQAMSDFSGLGGGEQNQWAEAVESLLYDPDQDGREPLLDRYLRTNKNIEPDERLVYEGWRERNVIGVFRVDARKGARPSLHNLIDEMHYLAYATSGAEAISFVQRGGYVMTRLVPVGDIWTISGTMRLFRPRDLLIVQTVAASLLKRFPTLVFNNPAKVEQGRKIVGEHHTTFLDGGQIVSGTGSDIIAAYRSFLNACSEASVAADPEASALVTAAEQIAPDDSFPPELAESDDVALYHHPLMGVSFLVCYGQVEAAYRTPRPMRRTRLRKSCGAMWRTRRFPVTSLRTSRRNTRTRSTPHTALPCLVPDSDGNLMARPCFAVTGRILAPARTFPAFRRCPHY